MEMKMVKVKFIAQGSNSAIGGFSSGDIASVGTEFAKHLVEEAMVAVYLEHPHPPQDDDINLQEQPKRGRKPRATNADE